MGTILTAPKLAKCLNISESLAARWFPHIDATLDKYTINSKLRIAAFIAQVGHESGHLRLTSENLNYSASGLLNTFGKYFDSKTAEAYARKPEMIASRVYANRMGNGNEASGDGWKYRGRGLIQVTGKENYTACSKSLGLNLVETPDLLAQDRDAAMSAGWFWSSKGLNNYADRKEFDTITRRINGGLNGKADRDALYQRALKVLDDENADTDKDKVAEVEPDKTTTISKEPTPIAKSTSFSEPAYTGGKTSYPNNIVYESPSGHIVEFDDTPGNERIHVYHRAGTYLQVDSTGDLTIKSIRDYKEFTKGDKQQSTEGDETINVDGQSYKKAVGDMILKTGGSMTLESPDRVQANTPLLSFDEEVQGPTATFQNTTTTMLTATTATAATLSAGVATVGILMIGIGAGASSFSESLDISGPDIEAKKPVVHEKETTTKGVASFEQPIVMQGMPFKAFPDHDSENRPVLCYWYVEEGETEGKWYRVQNNQEFVPEDDTGGTP